MTMRNLLLLSLAVVVVGAAAGCPAEIAAPGCKGVGCKNVDDNTEPPRLFVDPPFGLGYDCVTIGCDTERRMIVENRGGGAISLVLARLSVDTSTDFILRTADGPLPFDADSALTITTDAPLELFVRYVPTDGSADRGTVLLDWHDAAIAFDDAVLERVELPLSTRALGDAAASPDTTRLNFGFVPVGGYATRSVRVSNSGAGGVLSVGPVALEDGTAPVFVEPASGAWLAQFANPGAGADVIVNFRPDVAGTFFGAIIVRTSDGAQPAMRIEVAGTAIADPDAEPIARAIDFQAIRVNTSRTLPITIENRGGTPLTLQGGVQSGAGLTLSSTDAIEVAPLESTTVTLTWTPSTGGPLAGRVAFATNDPAEPSITIDVTGFSNAPLLSASPTAINFGSVVQSWTSDAQTFNITNTGSGELTISTIAFDVGSSSQIRFAEVPNLPIKISPTDPPVQVSVFMEASTLGTQSAVVLVGTDGVDGPLGVGGIARLQVNGVVVTCEQGCPVSNGTPSCGTGECRIGECINRFHDADLSFSSGCECGEDLIPGGAGTRRDIPGVCNGENIGPLGDDCATVREVRRTATLHAQTDVDLYSFHATDESRAFGCDFLGDSFGVRIRLENAPSGMQVCARQGANGVGCGGENQRRCVGVGGNLFFDGGNQIFGGSDTSDFTVWVEWLPGAAPQCGNYTLFVKGNDG